MRASPSLHLPRIRDDAEPWTRAAITPLRVRGRARVRLRWLLRRLSVLVLALVPAAAIWWGDAQLLWILAVWCLIACRLVW